MFKTSLNLFFRKSLFSTKASESRIFFGNFPIGVTEFTMKKFFDGCEIESILFFKKDRNGTSQGYGTILFSDENALSKAMELNNSMVQDKPVTIKKWEGEFSENRPRAPSKERIFPPSNCIYVGNIPFETDGEELITLFKEHGNVLNFRRPYDKENERSKG
jgi:RNA recognition motif-containing protein